MVCLGTAVSYPKGKYGTEDRRQSLHICRRWIFYHLIIWAAIQLIAIAIVVPETYHPVLLRNKARRMRKDTGDERYKAPLEILQHSILQVRFA
jgi:hypothetical protein